MAIIKCKMCGGDLEIQEGQSVGVCEYCGRRQTLPRLNSDRKANLYDRASHFRRNNDYDKAMGIYETILNEDTRDAEAYWSLVLCRYGIEYVEDPSTHKRVPTVNRAQYTSIYADQDYKSAISNADPAQKVVYEEEAAAIDQIQKGILEISQKEEPFDVFICYKETDSSGRRTPDSVLANDLYHQLTQEGYKVFFSRITLEDKLGQEYEPYIFAALNSAKVMVVLGTRPEYFSAVWVKNEWSRYLALIRSGEKKMLIPAYKDMNPYDLPEEFSHLQAQDMGKLGFMQDLIRGIRKITAVEEPQQETVVVQQGSGNVNALLDRGFMALEDREWEKADQFFEEVLNQDSRCAEAYWGKTLAEERESSLQNLVMDRIQTSETPQKVVLTYPGKPDIIDQHIQAFVIQHYLPREKLQKIYTFQVTYPAGLQYRKQQKLQEENYWNANRNLTRTLQFSDVKIQGQLHMALQMVYDEMDKRIADAYREDQEALKAAEEQYILRLREADEAAKELYQSADAERERVYCKLNKKIGQAVTAEEFINIQENAKLLGEYKDSRDLVRRCDKQIDLLKENEIKKQQKSRKRARVMILGSVTLIAVLVLGSLSFGIIHNAANRIQGKNIYERSVYSGSPTISAGNFNTIALQENGLAISTEIIPLNDVYYGPGKVSDWRNIQAVSVGTAHAVGLREDGTVIATEYTGDRQYYEGQCDVSHWEDIVAVSAAFHHTVGLKKDGTVISTNYCGDDLFNYGQCDVDAWKNIAAISAGNNHTVGLRKDGTVVSTQVRNEAANQGQCDVSDWMDIVAISAGEYHTVGLKKDGTVVATVNTGKQEYYHGECDVSGWTDIVAIGTGNRHTVGLRKDGTVVATEYTGDQKYYYGQCDVSNWTDIVAISVGDYHTVGLRKDGTVLSTGYNKFGQCDTAEWNHIQIPEIPD